MLSDYGTGVPSAQRLFLMKEVGQPFPTRPAEELAARFLETERTTHDDPTVRATTMPDVWRASGARVVGLARTSKVAAAAQTLTDNRVTLQPGAPPGQAPEWQITVPRPDSASGSSAAFPYLWVGFLSIAVVA